MYFKLMVKFHELQCVIEIQIKLVCVSLCMSVNACDAYTTRMIKKLKVCRD